MKIVFVSVMIVLAIFADNSSATSSPPQNMDLSSAQKVLENFLKYLNLKQFELAVPLFMPSDACNEYVNIITQRWDEMIAYAPHNERENKAKVLKYYCEAVGTCLKAEVVNYDNPVEGKYIFGVKFYKDDGSIFALGPCCAVVVPDEPPTTEFNFCVEKVKGTFKVRTAPVYVP